MASCKPARSAFPPTDSHWLSPHRRAFLESLAAQGYAVRTVKSFRLMVGRLCAEAETRGLVPNTLDATVMRELADPSSPARVPTSRRYPPPARR